MKTHVESCADCRDTLKLWSNFSERLRDNPPQTSPDFVERVMERIERPRVPWVFAWKRVFLPVAGFALITLAVGINRPNIETIPATENLLTIENDGELGLALSERTGLEDVMNFPEEEQ